MSKETHETVKKYFIYGKVIERIVANHLTSKGYKNVIVLEKKTAETTADIKDSSDNGDILFSSKDGSIQYRGECKSNRHIWKDLSSFQFNNLIVEAWNQWNKKDPKPDFYFIVNGDQTALIVVDLNLVEDEDWGTFENLYYPQNDVYKDAMTLPKGHKAITFHKLDQTELQEQLT